MRLAAIEYVINHARSLSPVLPVDLVGLGAYKLPYDQLLAAVIGQAEEICALRAKLERIGQNAAYWCEVNFITDEYVVEDLVSSILDEDA